MTTIANLSSVASSASGKNVPSAAREEAESSTDNTLESTGIFPPFDDSMKLSLSFRDMVARRTREFSDELLGVLARLDIRVEDGFSMSLKGSGKFVVGGTSKENERIINEYFKQNPELLKQFKEILALNTLLARQEAQLKYEKEKREAEAIQDPDLREKALKRVQALHLNRMTTIGELSDTLFVKDGIFQSAALDYIRTCP